MTIRPATVADQVALAELNAVVQQTHHDLAPEWFKPPEMVAIVDYFREALRSDALRIFVAESEGGVRGYALARLEHRPETAWTYGGLVVELDRISVEPAYRGRGLGRQLIDQVRSLASDVGATRLQSTVWEFNRHAWEVFERAGFAGDDDENGRERLTQRHQDGVRGRSVGPGPLVIGGRLRRLRCACPDRNRTRHEAEPKGCSGLAPTPGDYRALVLSLGLMYLDIKRFLPRRHQ